MRRRQRCGAEEGARVEVESGRGYRAAGVASAGRPRGERALTRSGARRGAARARGGRPGAALGWAGLAMRATLAWEVCGCRPGRLPSWAGNEAVARE